MKTTRLLAAASAVAFALGISACGSGSSSATQASTPEGDAPSTREGTTPGAGGGREMHTPGTGKEGGGAQRSKPSGQGFTPPAHHDSAGGSSQFKQKGGDNSIQEYGSQASGSELADAAAALHLYLDARAAGAWGAACEALAPKIAEDLVRQLGGGGKTACPKLLQSLSAGAPPAAMREAAEANVAALRSHGDVGFLLFKGADGEPFFIPMRREGGHWKVAAIAPSNLL